MTKSHLIKRIFTSLFFFLSLVFWLGSLLILINVSSNITFNLFFSHHDNARIPREIIQEYNYLKTILDQPDTKKKTLTNGLNDYTASEWPFMTLSITTFGMRNLAIHYPELRAEISNYMRKAIERAVKPEYFHFILNHYGDPFSSDKIEGNAFYLGHLTLMLAYYREVSEDGQYDELFHKFSRAFYENLANSPTLCVSSYRDLTWTSEQVVPLKALKIHDDIFGTNYKNVILNWENVMKQRFIPNSSGLLVTMIDEKTGDILEGERTIVNTWTILFLYDVLPEFCQNLYMNLKKGLLIRRLGFPLFKEYLSKYQRPTGDTGPIVWDASPVSTAFGMGTSVLMHDRSIYDPIRLLSDTLGLAVNWGSKRKYLAGGQVGTAAMFWLKTMELEAYQSQAKLSIPVLNILSIYTLLTTMMILSLWRINTLIKKWQKIQKNKNI